MSALEIRRDGEAITFEVRVAPRSSRNRILGARDGALKVALTAPPVDGAANDSLKKLVAKALGVAKSDVEIIRGQKARAKVLRVRGVRAEDVRFDGP
jgi:uncharacterized protein (TIGR00251 family)